MTHLVIWCLFALVFAVPPGKQQLQDATKHKYDALLAELKAGNTAIDFTELRMAYAESPDYDPYDVEPDARESMLDALSERNYREALEDAEEILNRKFVDITAHIVCSIAYRELQNEQKAGYHRQIKEGLVRSILKSGDGKSLQTAMIVISTDEEYVILDVLALRPTGQALLHDKGHSYDRTDGIDPKTKRRTTLYFNIDKLFTSLDKTLEK
jgi:hypothetical protein